jgi:hypothetical protein
LEERVASDSFVIRFPPRQPVGPVEQEIRRLADVDQRSLQPAVSESAREELRFADFLPDELADRAVLERLGDPAGVVGPLARKTRIIIADRA